MGTWQQQFGGDIVCLPLPGLGSRDLEGGKLTIRHRTSLPGFSVLTAWQSASKSGLPSQPCGSDTVEPPRDTEKESKRNNDTFVLTVDSDGTLHKQCLFAGRVVSTPVIPLQQFQTEITH